MSALSFVRIAALTAIALAGTIVAAHADETAYTRGPANLREGPGTSYPVIVSLPKNTEVAVQACTATWCAVTTPDDDEGFVARSLLKASRVGPDIPFNLQFSIGPNGPFLKFGITDQTPPPPEPSDTAEVCFYQQANFKGANFCVNPGDEDANIPGSFNDAIESILITGDVSVEVCADPDFGDPCKTYDQSVKKLPLSLRDEISSYSVDGGGNTPDTPDNNDDQGNGNVIILN